VARQLFPKLWGLADEVVDMCFRGWPAASSARSANLQAEQSLLAKESLEPAQENAPSQGGFASTFVFWR